MSIYQNALDVQNASVLSGVVFSFARDMQKVCDEVRASGGGTGDVNRHPVSRLYAEQIGFLSGAGCGDSDSYHRAYEACKAKVAEENLPKKGQVGDPNQPILGFAKEESSNG